MANSEQLEILKQGVDVWNHWRSQNPTIQIDLSEVDLTDANLNECDLSKTNLYHADLSGAKLIGARLWEAFLVESNLTKAILRNAHLAGANLFSAILSGADLRGANLEKAELTDTDFRRANLRNAFLADAIIYRADLSRAILSGAGLAGADLRKSNLSGANLRNADLSGADLSNANLIKADLRGSTLRRTMLLATRVADAKISGSNIYGVSVWDLHGDFSEQNELTISHSGTPSITVDNIKIAQFVHLILNNEEIRNVIDTLTSKSVLILGRFTGEGRKEILDALRDKLREYDLLPIVFDFDRPTDKDFTETIKTLAGLSYFVIADVTNPKSSPLELQATVPDYQIPFVPIIQEGEPPFAMMIDLQKKYNWVLRTVSYDSQETLMKVLKPLIIDPAMQKRQELRLIKAQEPEIISAKDFLAKGKV